MAIFIQTLTYAQDSLVFTLEVDVRAKQDGPRLPGADVRVIGTDMSMQTAKTDSMGHAEFLLKAETSYSIDVYAEYFLIAKGHETTIGEKESKVYYHLYQLQASACFMPMPMFFFKEGMSTPTEDTSIIVGNLMDKEEKEVLKDFLSNYSIYDLSVFGSVSENEDPKLKDVRAQLFVDALLELGIDSSKIIIDHSAKFGTDNNSLENIAYNSSREEYIPREYWDRCSGVILRQKEEDKKNQK